MCDMTNLILCSRIPHSSVPHRSFVWDSGKQITTFRFCFNIKALLVPDTQTFFVLSCDWATLMFFLWNSHTFITSEWILCTVFVGFYEFCEDNKILSYYIFGISSKRYVMELSWCLFKGLHLWHIEQWQNVTYYQEISYNFAFVRHLSTFLSFLFFRFSDTVYRVLQNHCIVMLVKGSIQWIVSYCEVLSEYHSQCVCFKICVSV